MLRKFTKLVIVLATTAKTSALCEKLFQKAREAIHIDIDTMGLFVISIFDEQVIGGSKY